MHSPRLHLSTTLFPSADAGIVASQADANVYSLGSFLRRRMHGSDGRETHSRRADLSDTVRTGHDCHS